jgi:hypothetical protein
MSHRQPVLWSTGGGRHQHCLWLRRRFFDGTARQENDLAAFPAPGQMIGHRLLLSLG